MKMEEKKFKFYQLFNNKDGKSSGSAFVGLYLGIIAGLCFIAGTVGWFLHLEFVMEYIQHVLTLGAMASLLMGVRKVAAIFKKDE